MREKVDKCDRLKGFINYLVSERKTKLELGRLMGKEV